MASVPLSNPPWTVPSIYGDTFCGKHVLITGSVPRDSKDPVEDYRTFIKSVMVYGYSDLIMQRLAELLGSWVLDERLFARVPSLPVLVVQYILAMRHAYQECFIMSSNTIALSFPRREADEGLIGIVNGKVHGFPELESLPMLTGDQMYSLLFTQGSEVVSSTFGIYDRIRYWYEGNSYLVEEPDGFMRALSVLKLSGKPLEEAEFEGLLYRDKDKAHVVVPKNYYTEEVLDEIREVWYDRSVSTDKAFDNLFLKVVPYFIDSKAFKEFFGVIPDKEDFTLTNRQIERVESGMMKFAAYFLSRMRNEH